MDHDERGSQIDHYASLDLPSLLALEAGRPNDVDLLVHIGTRYFASKDVQRSQAYFVRALKLDPYDGWAHLYFGTLLSALGCDDDALTHFHYAVDFLPNVACPQWCLASQYRKLGDFDNANFYFRRAVQIDPTDTMARKKLDQWTVENEA